MIVRLLAIDPQPEPGRSDVLCYQVPENSREYAVLTDLFSKAKIEYTQLASKPPRRRKIRDTMP